MTSEFQPQRLDVAAFARAKASLAGRDPLSIYKRLTLEAIGPVVDVTVDWRAQGEQRSAVDGVSRPALHLQARTVAPMSCQRCLGAVQVPLDVDRHIVFAQDEDSAAALDDASEDDVLALASDLNLRELLEDELLLALPLVPRHAQCPDAVAMSAQDADFEAAQDERPHPFAGLAALKKGKPH